MTEDEVRRHLDQMGVPWDAPVRAEALEFAKRDTDAKLLWLFIESRRKPAGNLVDRAIAGAGGGSVVLIGLMAHALGLTDKVMPR